MAAYTQRQASYIASVGGRAHQFALETIGELEAEIERLRAENERLDRIFTHVRLTDRLLAISDYEAAEAAERGE